MKKYYKKEDDKSKYVRAQIERHDKKIYKERFVEYYEYPCNHIIEHLPDSENTLNMIFLGTRNEREKDVFDRLFNRNDMKNKIVNVKSLDIASTSEADYIMDFNKFPNDWENKWDIIFSNSIDHCIDAGDTFKEWVRVLKPNGLLYLMFDLFVPYDLPTEADCCVFEDGDIQKIINDNSSNIITILNIKTKDDIKGNYNHLLIRKNEI